MTSPKVRSEFSDNGSASRKLEGDKSDSEVAKRVRAAMADRNVASHVRKSGIPSSTLHSILTGTIPRADTALKLARALGRSVEWLLTGADAPKSAEPGWLSDATAHDWIAVPRYDLFAFVDEGKLAKPEPLERFPIRRDWLAREARYTDKLWIADMPTGGMEDVAAEGEQLLCRDIDGEEINDRGVYIFLLGGRPIVRRAQLTIEGLVLRDSDPTTEPLRVAKHDLDSLEGLVPIGRVIGSIALRRA